ncbi:ester cyclase [Prolixibacteraceae bacterium Z1-6]|uniref:Ester cyclase n=1 Tax=Draconibacterium aestuarii TaxID=2998507 RepID=A0A9X3F585_9BACT|nr:ester cyclase [Prolixibacteraceae bacterium Z1-6]
MLESAELKHQKEQERRNKKLIERYWNGKWNERRMEILDELQSPDVVYHGTSMTMNGLEEYKQGYANYLSESQNSSIEVLDLMAENDKVMSRCRLKYVPKEAGDKEVVVDAFTVFKVEHGKIVEEWEIFDELGMMKQMGAELPT